MAWIAAEAGLLGGIAARITGGKFDDGFTVSAAGYLFNSVAHSFKAIPFKTDSGQQILDINNHPMMRPDDVNPGDIVASGESPEGGYSQLQAFKRGGDWDYQRVGPGMVFEGAFTDFANVAIGLYSAAAGLSETAVLSIANYYAQGSTFAAGTVMDQNYPNLRAENVYDIKLGFQLVNAGAIRSSAPIPRYISPF